MQAIYFISGIVKLLIRGRQISSDECVSPLTVLSVLALLPSRTLISLSPTVWNTCCFTKRTGKSGAELRSSRFAHTDLPRRFYYTLMQK